VSVRYTVYHPFLVCALLDLACFVNLAVKLGQTSADVYRDSTSPFPPSHLHLLIITLSYGVQ
jgi:hypothetical protein